MKKLFAIKVPEREKEAMNYIANKTNKKLTELFYERFQTTLCYELGNVLINEINCEEYSSLVKEIFDREKEIRDWLGELWNGEEFLDVELRKVPMKNVLMNLGKMFLKSNRRFEEITDTLVKGMFIDAFLYTYIKLSLSSLTDDDWSASKIKIEILKDELIRKTSEAIVVEPLEVQIAEK
ncbi:MAG: hypothetical protein AB1779_01965 [Candidatus Thermoplasmatota archaeon]